MTFAAAIFEAAGLDPTKVLKLRGILAAEHGWKGGAHMPLGENSWAGSFAGRN